MRSIEEGGFVLALPTAFFWKVFSCFCFASLQVIAHYLARRPQGALSPQQLAFFQTGGGLAFLSLVWGWQKKKFFCWGSPFWLAWGRALCATGGTTLWFWSLKAFPLPYIAAFKLMGPLITLWGACLLLHDKLNLPRFIALTIALIGAGLIFFKDMSADQDLALYPIVFFIPLGALLCFAGSNLLGKQFVKREKALRATFSLLFLSTIFLGCLAQFNWAPCQLSHTPWIAAMGLLSAGAYYGLNRALELAALSYLIPLSFLRFIFVLCMNCLFFTQSLSTTSLLGVGCIAATGLYLSTKESR